MTASVRPPRRTPGSPPPCPGSMTTILPASVGPLRRIDLGLAQAAGRPPPTTVRASRSRRLERLGAARAVGRRRRRCAGTRAARGRSARRTCRRPGRASKPMSSRRCCRVSDVVAGDGWPGVTRAPGRRGASAPRRAAARSAADDAVDRDARAAAGSARTRTVDARRRSRRTADASGSVAGSRILRGPGRTGVGRRRSAAITSAGPAGHSVVPGVGDAAAGQPAYEVSRPRGP